MDPDKTFENLSLLRELHSGLHYKEKLHCLSLT